MTIVVSKCLDCRGMDVFVSILKLPAALAPLRKGEVLELLSDDPAAHLDIAAWSRLTGYKLLDIYAREDFTRFFIQK
ncbi:MAG: sulfurtransferase TusA family protein [Calditrichaeota bacterium]|nr:MAG: sulfurtransferase TusA family protein [Calditrichota bacterium]